MTMLQGAGCLLRRIIHRLCRRTRPGIWRLFLVLVLAPGFVLAQQSSWEQLIGRGNRALEGGALSQAEHHYLQALQVAGEFPPNDLRRVTSARNLAQVRMRRGNYGAADSLYRQATATAAKLLGSQHPYFQALQSEWDDLRAAMAQSATLDEGVHAPLTFKELIRLWALRFGNGLTPQLGPVIPLSGGLSDTQKPGLAFSLAVRMKIFDLGPVPFLIGLEVIQVSLPGERPVFDPPYVIKGTTVTLSPALGPLSLTLGAGLYAVGLPAARRTVPGLTGGLRLIIKGRPGNSAQLGLKVGVAIQALQITNATPTATPGTFLHGGLFVGYRW
ncbi:MAG: hypothetical protein IID14_05800 [Candidatus Marinimicrobia bacterium]|nr:hypothetical protein [Candidatus Neomarinimicrobiota bacterium]